jgi:hypothetical protein
MTGCKNRTMSRMRSKVELSFRIMKHFWLTKARYRGMKKNDAWRLAAFARVNLYRCRKWLTL